MSVQTVTQRRTLPYHGGAETPVFAYRRTPLVRLRLNSRLTLPVKFPFRIACFMPTYAQKRREKRMDLSASIDQVAPLAHPFCKIIWRIDPRYLLTVLTLSFLFFVI